MRDYATVSPVFWTGQTGRRLKALGPDAMLVALYLVTSPHSNAMGMFYLPVLYISHETGLTMEGASEALRRGEKAGFCAYDQDAEVVWVFEMARFQIGQALSPKDNRVKWVNEEYAKLPKCKFLKDFFDKYASAFHLKEARGEGQKQSPLEAPSKPLQSQDQEQEQEQELRNTPSTEGVSLASPPDGGPANTPAQPKRARDDCPHQEIVALYHELLSVLPKVRVWGKGSRTQLRSRWREAKERQDIAWWRTFFQRVQASDFLCGRTAGSKGPFLASLTWLVNRTNFEKVLNGAYDNRGPRTGSRQADRNAIVAQAFAQGE